MPAGPGMELAFEFSRALVQSGLCITSGLALGIDAAAHRGALSGPGPTVAVAGTGLDCVYPVRHREWPGRSRLSGRWSRSFRSGRRPSPRTSRGATASSAACRSGR